MMGLPEVMPAGQLYDMVVFQGSEIAELTVLQPPPQHVYAAVPAPPPAQAPPPAVPASPWGAPQAAPPAQPDLNNPWGTAPPQPAAPKQAAPNPLPTPAPAPTVSVGTGNAAKAKPLSYAHAAGGTNPVKKPQASAVRGGRGGAGGRGSAPTAGGRGGAPTAGGRGAGRGAGRGGYSASLQHHMSVPLAIPTTEFDFQESLTKFDKDRIAQDLSGKKGFAKSSEEVYQKDDFFDSLSCEALDRQQGGRPKYDRRRQPNSATFGLDGGRESGTGGARGGRSQRGGRGSGSHYQRKPVEA